MISNNSVKQRLKKGNRLNGCWIEMFNPIAAEIVAMSGYDTAFIDLEHGPGSYTEAISMMQAVSIPNKANDHGCAPMLRVSSSDIVDIKRALDIGPEGIMVPNVRSVDEARSTVEACRYGPAGNRGAAPRIIRASGYGDDMAGYADYMATEFLLIAQIETEQAVNQIEQIAAVEGIDMLFIGPSDLSASLGAIGDYESSKFNDAFDRIEQATLEAGKLLGTIPLPNRDPARLFKAGHTLVISGGDTILLQQAAGQDVERMHKAAN
jgi:2-keto-3-deoxy-L-rhamnonate aldolase RhmA